MKFAEFFLGIVHLPIGRDFYRSSARYGGGLAA
jgi:hypothetical protein